MKREIAAALLILAVSGAALADLTVGLMPAINSVPLVVAEEKGYFAAEGVRVSLTLFQSQMYREAALQSNAIDGTVSDLINAIQGWSRQTGARVTSATEGDFGLLASPRSTLRDLAGWKSRGSRKVPTGLLEASIVYYVTERILLAAGADPASVELVPIVQVPVRMEMLLAGQVEAACLPEPLATVAVQRGARLLADSSRIGTTVGVLLFTQRALAEKPGEIAAFYRAYDRAVFEVNAAPGAYRAAVVGRCEFPASVKDSLRFPRFRRAFAPGPSDVGDVAAWMREKGLIEALPSYADIVLDSFVSENARTP
jgi:NitT/TauT family transport system substrate-binding protein